jgi:hypothetical protein
LLDDVADGVFAYGIRFDYGQSALKSFHKSVIWIGSSC